MKPNVQKNEKRRTGFSLIEMLVAMAILTVIVMLMSMLFQQTSLAWRTGVRRADSYTKVRTVMGALQRAASGAVDENCIPEALRQMVQGQGQNFSGSDLAFYTLTGSGFPGNDADKPPLRAIKFVTFANGKLKEYGLDASGGSVRSEMDLQKLSNVGSSTKVTVSSISFEKGPAIDSRLPAFVRMKVSVRATGESYDIGAASAGPDKQWNTGDDIRTWTERN